MFAIRFKMSSLPLFSPAAALFNFGQWFREEVFDSRHAFQT
jgi:hypothetical protein